MGKYRNEFCRRHPNLITNFETINHSNTAITTAVETGFDPPMSLSADQYSQFIHTDHSPPDKQIHRPYSARVSSRITREPAIPPKTRKRPESARPFGAGKANLIYNLENSLELRQKEFSSLPIKSNHG